MSGAFRRAAGLESSPVGGASWRSTFLAVSGADTEKHRPAAEAALSSVRCVGVLLAPVWPVELTVGTRGEPATSPTGTAALPPHDLVRGGGGKMGHLPTAPLAVKVMGWGDVLSQCSAHPFVGNSGERAALPFWPLNVL